MIDSYIDGYKLTSSGGIMADSEGNFLFQSNKIISYGKHKLKFTVSPPG